MKSLIITVLVFIGLLGCPLRAEIEKKVFAPSPTLTERSLIEAEYSDKYSVSCPRAVHKNLDTLTSVSFSVVLDIDHGRNKIKVIEFYPAKSVEELDQKIAARKRLRIEQKEKTVIAQAIAATPPPSTTPAPTAPAVEKMELVGATGDKIPFVYDAVVGDAAKALGTIIDQRGQISALKEQVGKLTEQLNNKPLTSVPAPAATSVPDAELVKANAALQQHVAELNNKLAAAATEKVKSDADQAKTLQKVRDNTAPPYVQLIWTTVLFVGVLALLCLMLWPRRHKKTVEVGVLNCTPPLRAPAAAPPLESGLLRARQLTATEPPTVKLVDVLAPTAPTVAVAPRDLPVSEDEDPDITIVLPKLWENITGGKISDPPVTPPPKPQPPSAESPPSN